ncbi:DUF1616 domain-containing protein [Halorubrum ezzemoulense]|uniref:DUF1616 domain-containing protein n=1 Tax=Halorubrum ezzemoulense TaxID=337243 RepID=UPI00232D0C5B|nr:DUF1616 domain-containing protein [Halorubrum ezzemoulense]MDB9235645.1 DUF1616 domain-containing protein [Halorubrum ezzemoulense]MDB9253014.1 DUF1616 domain-containing protein [Halorubrum ezzemoulense]MDB9255273.1 DUF1616 domain-containing protein [Halorubrum ezzemoulense]MDB9275984.1 DUF1616 domain-containing protein [Halorubrum ezzemoulense]
MVDRQDVWLILPHPIRRLPADLAAVVILTLLTLTTVFVPVVNETPLRVGFGLTFVLFLPGYAFIAALFPESGSGSESTVETAEQSQQIASNDDSAPKPVPGTEAAAAHGDTEPADSEPTDSSGIDGIERTALSFGLSIAIVPLIGLILNFTPWGIRLVPIVTSVAGFTLVCVAVAAQRRLELPPDERFVVPYHDWIAATKQELFDPDDRVDGTLNIVLAISVLLAIGSVGYAVAVPPQGEQFTEFYLLTENPDGELVADGYPETMTRGETAELTVGIGNNEYQSTTYTVVVQVQEVNTADNSTTVLDRTEIDRFEATVSHNETHHQQHTLRPTQTGEDLRVQYLLYKGSLPDTPTSENAYRDLHLWIDVEETA